MEAEYGDEVLQTAMAGTTTEEGWQTPTREDCRIPVVRPCPPPPPRKKAVPMAPELGESSKRRRVPPKGGYFQPPELESLFVLRPTRRQATSSCA